MRVELVAICALILTVKFDEIDSIVPDLNLFKSINWNKIKVNCSIEEILECELICLNLLQHQINYFTPYHFINYFCSNGIVFKDEILKSYEVNVNEEETSQNFTLYEKIYENSKEALFLFIEGKYKSNLEEDYLYINSIDIACACISIGRASFLETAWDKRLESIYNIKFEDFFMCYDKISR